jgi:hypothetical protein
VVIEHLLHLAWIHVIATMDDQILLAADDVVVAVLVHPADVAGAEQAIGVDAAAVASG